MTLRPCIDCGDPTSSATRCTACTPDAGHVLSATRRGYGAAWRRLSTRARRLQPWCTDCGSVEDLTVDHSRQAWERHDAGLEIRLEDVEVVCRSCNGRRGRARPSTWPGRPPSEGQGPAGSRSLGYTPPGGIQ